MTSWRVAWTSLRVFFFFFKAEAGIRDGHVTGVQTCALPIYAGVGGEPGGGGAGELAGAGLGTGQTALAEHGEPPVAGVPRSEERRVGKEGRSRWSADH